MWLSNSVYNKTTQQIMQTYSTPINTVAPKSQ